MRRRMPVKRSLSEEKVIFILESYGKLSANEIKAKLGCRNTIIWQIWRCVNYKDIYRKWGKVIDIQPASSVKLTDEEVEEILARRAVPNKILAEEFGVSRTTIVQIKSGLRRKDVYRKVMRSEANSHT